MDDTIRRPGVLPIAKRLAVQNPSWTQERVNCEAKRIFIEQQRAAKYDSKGGDGSKVR